jgi:hypothetical protein
MGKCLNMNVDALQLTCCVNFYSFLAVAGVGVGLSTVSLAVQTHFSLPSDRVEAVAALTLFVSYEFAYSYQSFIPKIYHSKTVPITWWYSRSGPVRRRHVWKSNLRPPQIVRFGYPLKL